MHRVLSIPDTLSLIFPHISQQDLRNCAVVCRAWFDPVIETLWASTHFNNLCGVFLAADQLQVIKAGGVYSVTTLIDVTVKVPCEKDWNRFYRYTRNIRSLRFSTEIVFQPKFLQFFLRPLHTANSSLFPLGRTLNWEVYTEANSQLCIFLLHHMPQVVKLGCKVGCSVYPLTWEGLGTVLQKCTKLEFFNIRHDGDRRHIFQALATLPRLKEIRGSFVGVEADGVGPGAFPELESICWVGRMDPNFFRSSWFPPPNLLILGSSLITANSLRDIVILLSSRKSLLHTLTMEVIGGFDSTHLRAISNLHLLQELNISTQSGRLDVTEEDIAHLAINLPKLKTLALNKDVKLQEYKLTHKTIEYLINYCPDIEKIRLPFDASQVPLTSLAQWANKAHLQEPSTRLEIDPRWWSKGNPAMIAAWLLAICYEKNKTPKLLLDRINTIGWQVWQVLDKPEGILELLE